MTETVYLVSCTKEKQASAAAARDLYVSDWFTKARAFVESTGRPWFILSALYLELSPATVVEPYNFTLHQGDGNDRVRKQTWARQTADRIALRHAVGTHFVILAGQHYREFLLPELAGRGFTTEVPMQGLGIGQQKRWLMDQAAGRPAAATIDPHGPSTDL